MKKINKNILIGLGTITVLTAPLITVVSCGSKPHKDDGKDNNNDNDGNNNSTTSPSIVNGDITFSSSQNRRLKVETDNITLTNGDDSNNGSFKVGDIIHYTVNGSQEVKTYTINKKDINDFWENEVILANNDPLPVDIQKIVDDVDTEISKNKGWTDDFIDNIFHKLKLKTISFPHLKTMNISNLGLFSFHEDFILDTFNIPNLDSDIIKYKFGEIGGRFDKNTKMNLPAGFKDLQKLHNMFGDTATTIKQFTDHYTNVNFG